MIDNFVGLKYNFRESGICSGHFFLSRAVVLENLDLLLSQNCKNRPFKSNKRAKSTRV